MQTQSYYNGASHIWLPKVRQEPTRLIKPILSQYSNIDIEKIDTTHTYSQQSQKTMYDKGKWIPKITIITKRYSSFNNIASISQTYKDAPIIIPMKSTYQIDAATLPLSIKERSVPLQTQLFGASSVNIHL